jgi:hypothetical protein
MKHALRSTPIAAIFAIALCGVAAAQEAAGVDRNVYPRQALTCPDALLRGCCDIYCPKPIPCVSCFSFGCGKDDYCRKPYPCIPCLNTWCTSGCYCKKPFPDLCRPLAADYFICAGWGTACGEPNASCAIAVPSDALSEVAEDHTNRVDRAFDRHASPPAALDAESTHRAR